MKASNVKRRRMWPASVVGLAKGLPPCIIAMEACCGVHHLGRLLEAQGHEVRLVGERTALINQLRAILLERGIVIAQGRRNFERELDAMLCEEQGLAVSPRLRMLIEDIREEWRVLDRRIAAFDRWSNSKLHRSYLHQ
jgi:transposase